MIRTINNTVNMVVKLSIWCVKLLLLLLFLHHIIVGSLMVDWFVAYHLTHF